MIKKFTNCNISCFRTTENDFNYDFFSCSRTIIQNELTKIAEKYKYQKTSVLIDSWTSNDMILKITVFSNDEKQLNQLFKNNQVIDNFLNIKNDDIFICFYFIGLDFSSFVSFKKDDEKIIDYLKNFKKIIKKQMDEDETFKDVLRLKDQSEKLNSLFS